MTYRMENSSKINLLQNSGFGVWSNSEDLYTTAGTVPNQSDTGANMTTAGSLVLNGGFDTDTDPPPSWTAAAGATLTTEGSGETGNCMMVLSDASGNRQGYQAVTVEVGKLYEFSFWFKKGSGVSGSIYLGTTVGGVEYERWDAITDAGWTQYTAVFEATTTTVYITFRSVSASQTAYFDSVSIYEVTPGIVSGTTGPDGWDKTAALDIFREQWDGTAGHFGDSYNVQNGSQYSLKIVNVDGTTDQVRWPIAATSTTKAHIAKFAGRTVALGMWVKDTAGAADNIFIRVDDGVSTTDSSFHAGDSTWTWLEVSHIVSNSATKFLVTINTAGDTNDTAYISQPMLVFGSSIGEGNFVQPPGEIVWLEKRVIPTGYSAGSVAVDTIINLESTTDGKIPKGAQSLYIPHFSIIAAAAAPQNVYLMSEAAKYDGMSVTTQVTAQIIPASGMTLCSATGDIYIDIGSTSVITISIGAVQVAP